MTTEKIIVIVVSLICAVVAFYCIYLQGREDEFLGRESEEGKTPASPKQDKSQSVS